MKRAWHAFVFRIFRGISDKRLKILTDRADVSDLASGELCQDFEILCLTPGQPPNFSVNTIAYLDKLPNWSDGYPQSWELFLNELPVPGGAFEKATDHIQDSKSLLSAMNTFITDIRRSWQIVRRIKEGIVFSTLNLDGHPVNTSMLRYEVSILSSLVAKMGTLSEEIALMFRDLVEPAFVTTWLSARFEPIREEEAVITCRIHQMPG